MVGKSYLLILCLSIQLNGSDDERKRILFTEWCYIEMVNLLGGVLFNIDVNKFSSIRLENVMFEFIWDIFNIHVN